MGPTEPGPGGAGAPGSVGLRFTCRAFGCGLLDRVRSVTPADRASAYEAQAGAVQAACKAYAFDRAAGLVPEVPAMVELCER